MHVRILMALHYMGYFGSMILLWLLLVAIALKIQGPFELALKVLLSIAGLVFGVIGIKIAYKG